MWLKWKLLCARELGIGLSGEFIPKRLGLRV